MDNERAGLVITSMKGIPCEEIRKEAESMKEDVLEEDLPRLERASTENIALLPNEQNIYVKSIKDDEVKNYKIYNYDEKQSCSCTDYHMRKSACKHLWKYRILYNKNILPRTDVDMNEWTIKQLEKDINFMSGKNSQLTERFKNLKEDCKEKSEIELIYEDIHEKRGEIYNEFKNI